MKKGQITTGVLIASAIGLGGLIFTLFGINTYSINKTDNQVQSVVKDVSGMSILQAKTEARYEDILRRLDSIDLSIKELNKRK